MKKIIILILLLIGIMVFDACDFITKLKQSENKSINNNDNKSADYEQNNDFVLYYESLRDSTKNHTKAKGGYDCVIDLDYITVQNVENQEFAQTINDDFIDFFAGLTEIPANYIKKNGLKETVKKKILDLKKQERDEEDSSGMSFFYSMSKKEVFQNENLISISYDWSNYTGGAHGYGSVTCFNYDKETEREIKLENLTDNLAALTDFAREKFIIQNGELEDFWFEDNNFFLTPTFSISKDKLTFYYSPYEIASYAAGIITLELKIKDIEHLFNY